MAAPALAPITRQVSGPTAAAPAASGPDRGQPLAAAVAELPVLDASGRRVPFGALFRERRAVVIFVRVSAGGGARRLGWSCSHAGRGAAGPWEGAGSRARSAALPVVVR